MHRQRRNARWVATLLPIDSIAVPYVEHSRVVGFDRWVQGRAVCHGFDRIQLDQPSTCRPCAPQPESTAVGALGYGSA